MFSWGRVEYDAAGHPVLMQEWSLIASIDIDPRRAQGSFLRLKRPVSPPARRRLSRRSEQRVAVDDPSSALLLLPGRNRVLTCP